MTTIYTKSLITDFLGSLNLDQLTNEINSHVGITPTCITVTNVGDDVDIVFDSSLSAGEQTTMNTIVTNHDPVTIYQNIMSQQINKSTNNTEYHKIRSFVFDGSIYNSPIQKIEAIIKQNATSASIRIYDHTNVQIIAEKTGISNTSLEYIDLGTVSNIPSTKSTFNVQLKVVGDGFVNCDEIRLLS